MSENCINSAKPAANRAVVFTPAPPKGDLLAKHLPFSTVFVSRATGYTYLRVRNGALSLRDFDHVLSADFDTRELDIPVAEVLGTLSLA